MKITLFMSNFFALNRIIHETKFSGKVEGKYRHKQDQSLWSMITDWSEYLKISMEEKVLSQRIII